MLETKKDLRKMNAYLLKELDRDSETIEFLRDKLAQAEHRGARLVDALAFADSEIASSALNAEATKVTLQSLFGVSELLKR